jgi:hypothetical protein
MNGDGDDVVAGSAGTGAMSPNGSAGTAGSDAGAGGAAAGGGGRAGSAAGRGGAGSDSVLADKTSDSDLIGGLITVVARAPGAALGALGDLLTGATALTPALISDVLDGLQGASLCGDDRSVCDMACDLVAQRCRECNGDSHCKMSLARSCGAQATRCSP